MFLPAMSSHFYSRQNMSEACTMSLLGNKPSNLWFLPDLLQYHLVSRMQYSQYPGMEIILRTKLDQLDSCFSLSIHRYIVASMLGLLPTQTLNIYIGSTLRSMEEVVTNSDHMMTGWIILIIQLVITIMVAMFIVRRARVELDRTLQLDTDLVTTQQQEMVKEVVVCQ